MSPYYNLERWNVLKHLRPKGGVSSCVDMHYLRENLDKLQKKIQNYPLLNTSTTPDLNTLTNQFNQKLDEYNKLVTVEILKNGPVHKPVSKSLT